MTEKPDYEAPALTEIGTLHELTLQKFNKVGGSNDTFTGQTGLSGSIVPFP